MCRRLDDSMRFASTQGRDRGPECDIGGGCHVLARSAVLEAQVDDSFSFWRRRNDHDVPDNPHVKSGTAHSARGPVRCALRQSRHPADRGTALDAHRRHPAPSWPPVRPGVFHTAGDPPAGGQLRHAADVRRKRRLVPECVGGQGMRGHLSREGLHPRRARGHRLRNRRPGVSAVRAAAIPPHRHQRVPATSYRLRRNEMNTSPRPRNLGLALAVIAVAQLMVVLDVAIVNVALPSIQRSLHFTAGSLAGGLATTSALLILARVAQGVGGAIVAPTALSLLADTFAEGKARNRALGVYSAVSAGGGALGLLLGGVITNYFSWRWILFVNVPVGIVLALVAPRVLLATKGQPGRLDLPGAFAVTGGATLLVYSLSRAATHGWRDSVTVATLAIALGLLVVFVAIEALSREPLMPLRIFVNRNRSGAYVLSLAVGAVLSGMLFLLTLFLQNVLVSLHSRPASPSSPPRRVSASVPASA